MIPVVDIGCYIRAVEKAEDAGAAAVWDSAEGKETAQQLHDAFCRYGFCYLSNHGVPHTVVDKVYAASKTFFELPVNVKEKYVRGVETNWGWGCLERERLNPERPSSDYKETFNFSPCDEGIFPEEVPDMNKAFVDFFQSCDLLNQRILDVIGVAMGFKDVFYLRRCHSLSGQKGNYSTVRSLFYPPPSSLKEGQIQCSEHADYGSITQDSTGGLQILGKDGEYHDIQPVSGAVLVNIGDLMQRWTADRFPSTKHRVIVPRKAIEEGRTRQSLAFFSQPDDDALITCLDGSDTYPPITSRDYLFQRYAATY